VSSAVQPVCPWYLQRWVVVEPGPAAKDDWLLGLLALPELG